MRRRQQGAGLPEILVAMVLSLLVALVSATMLQAANSDFLHTGSASRMDDSGYFALSVMGQAVRQAGYPGEPGAVPAASEGGTPPLAVAGRDASGVVRDADGMGPPAPAVNGSDVLAIRYAPSATGAVGAGSAMLNCAGFPAGAGEWAWSIFYVARAGDGVAELRCKYKGGHAWAADAVVRGVDAFHVLYGIDTDSERDGIANRYLTAGALDALDDALPEPGRSQRLHWRRVVSVRIALLLHGEVGSRLGDKLASYALLPDADPAARIDEAALPIPMRHRARRVFSATVALRNP